VHEVLDIWPNEMWLLVQIFNFLNARKLNNDFNVFEGIHRSYIFLAILIFIIGAQVLAAQHPLPAIWSCRHAMCSAFSTSTCV
jgi:Cation transporting ATPase, C-terminus